MYYVYILYSKKLRKIYKGSCSDLRKRMDDHNYKRVPFTAPGVSWVLVYYEAFINKSDAIREEKFLKTGKGRERIKYLLQNYFKEYGEVPERSKGAPC